MDAFMYVKGDSRATLGLPFNVSRSQTVEAWLAAANDQEGLPIRLDRVNSTWLDRVPNVTYKVQGRSAAPRLAGSAWPPTTTSADSQACLTDQRQRSGFTAPQGYDVAISTANRAAWRSPLDANLPRVHDGYALSIRAAEPHPEGQAIMLLATWYDGPTGQVMSVATTADQAESMLFGP